MNKEILQLGQHVNVRETALGVKMLYDNNEGVMYELNETASAVISLIEHANNSEEDVISNISARFSEDNKQIEQDIKKFLTEIKGRGLTKTRQDTSVWREPIYRARQISHDC
jgi:uncharacterized protein (UPF0335 family)